jgi:hypothetical protein
VEEKRLIKEEGLLIDGRRLYLAYYYRQSAFNGSENSVFKIWYDSYV